VVYQKQPLKCTNPLTGGHTEAVSLPVDGEVGERYRKKLQQRSPRPQVQTQEVDRPPVEGLPDEELVRIWESLRVKGFIGSPASQIKAESWDEAAQDVAVLLLEMRRDGVLPANPDHWAKSTAKHRRREIQYPDRVTEKDADGKSRRVRIRLEQPVAPVVDETAPEGELSPLILLLDRPSPPDEEAMREEEEAEARLKVRLLEQIVREATAAGRKYSQAVLDEGRTGVRTIPANRFKEEKDRLIKELKKRLAAYRAAEDLFIKQPT
jgi:hypothetical protein